MPCFAFAQQTSPFVIPASLQTDLTALPLELAQIGKGLPFFVMARIIQNQNASLTSHLEIKFGRLSEAQFLNLKSAYLAPATLHFDPNASYFLKDFLPWPMQIMAGKWVRPIEAPDLDFSQFKHLNPLRLINTLRSDCWNVVYEAIRHGQSSDAAEIDLFLPGGLTMKNIFLSDQYSQPVVTINTAAVSS